MDEIRATGVCTIEAFTEGGLVRPYRRKLQLGKPMVKVEAGDGTADALFATLDFLRCELFEKLHSVASPSVNFDVLPNAEPSAVRLQVRRYDLFLRKADVMTLRKQGISVWKVVPYPLEARRVPLPIYWAYQASIALNRDQIAMPDGVLGWLHANAPEDAYAIRGIKTLTSMVRLNYRYMSDFDAVALCEFPRAQELSGEYISKPIRLLIDITAVCSSGRRLEDYEKRQIWSKLVAAGFRKTSIRDLYAVLVQVPVTDGELEKFERTQS